MQWKSAYELLILAYFFEKIEILSNILKKSNVGVIESSDSWSFNLAFDSGSSEWAF